MSAMNLERGEHFRSSLAALLAGGAFTVVMALIAGDLNRLAPVLLPGVFVLVLSAHLVRNFLATMRLRPVRLMLSKTRDEDGLVRGESDRALDLLGRFPVREAIVGFTLWPLGAFVLVLLSHFFMATTPWEALFLIVLGLAGGTVDALCIYWAAVRYILPLQLEVESRSELEPASIRSLGRLTHRILGIAIPTLVVGLGVVCILWLGVLREGLAARILLDHEEDFASVVRGFSTEGLDAAEMAEVIRGLDRPGQVKHTIVLVGPEGRVIAGLEPTGEREEWFARIVAAEAKRWQDLRAPFLYMARKVSTERTMIWIADSAELFRPVIPSAWLAGVGCASTLLLCMLLLWIGISGAHLPLRRMTLQLRSMASRSVGEDRETAGADRVDELVDAMAYYIRSVQGALEEGRKAVEELVRERNSLLAQLNSIGREAGERSEMVEQTAASVVEMRSSIQSVGEQVEMLQESATDCSSTVFEIDQSVREVASSAESLMKMTEDAAKSFHETGSYLFELSETVEELALQAGKASTSIGIIDDAIKEIEHSSSQTHLLSREVSDIAGLGADSVREAMGGIRDIRDVTDEARSVINRLGSRMEEVGKILTVISDVAERTNLLALNAAIIAAAAGEHGKGFAVVAEEIKKLADRTSSSTKEISALIKSVQSESRKAIDAIERGFDSVKRGEMLASNAGEALQQILSSVSQVNKMADDISSRASEHALTSRVIAVSMREISSMVLRIKDSMKEQTESSRRIDQVSEKMRDEARFVYRSANEQSQAITGVSRNMERMTEMTGFIRRAMSEQSQGVNHVAVAAEQVRDSVVQEVARLYDIEKRAESIATQERELASRLEDLGRHGGGGA
ncbi:MAG: hypothetical protein JXR96_27560 [Deltaproteobacteria bacterium]|nr:hypothetical protein [Deltaproteobacteria bacterium]